MHNDSFRSFVVPVALEPSLAVWAIDVEHAVNNHNPMIEAAVVR
jgi:hypothetical protein